MGIRVSKHLGYGVADLKGSEDPRWDHDRLRSMERRDELECNLTGFLEWLEKPEVGEKLMDLAEYEGWGMGRERGKYFTETTEFFLMRERIKDLIKKKVYWSGWSLYRHYTEFGLPNVLLLQPAEHQDWSRRDDIIDYYEESFEPRVTLLKDRTGIYPYDGFMKRFREPSPEVAERLNQATKLLQSFATHTQKDREGANIDGLLGGDYNQLVGRWDPKLPPLVEDPLIREHFIQDWRPRVPIGILAGMLFLDVFPDLKSPDSMLNSLRPMIYVYWS